MQSALFHDRIEDAMDETIRACGGRKKFACEMWPDKPQRDAHNLLDACLNPERREKFSPAQLIYIMKCGKQAGCHALMNYFAFECGYEAKPIHKEEEADRLATAIEAATKALADTLASAERIRSGT